MSARIVPSCMAEATSRCWTPSCRSRCRRLRSWLWATTMRCRELASSSDCGRDLFQPRRQLGRQRDGPQCRPGLGGEVGEQPAVIAGQRLVGTGDDVQLADGLAQMTYRHRLDRIVLRPVAAETKGTGSHPRPVVR